MRLRGRIAVLAVAAALSVGLHAVASAGSGATVGARLQAAEPSGPIPPPPIPLTGKGVRQLAYGSLPGGRSFTIVGRRYRFGGRSHFSLDIAITRRGGGGGGASYIPAQSPGVLVYTADVACGRHAYAVVFGLLRAPSDKVIAREGHSRRVLKHVSIPAVLRAHGVLVYASLTRLPSELTVVRPDGKRVLDDKSPNTRCFPGIVSILRPSQ
jgi:hypothetical protein